MPSVNKTVKPYLAHMRELRAVGVPIAEINRILVECGILSTLAQPKTLANCIRLGVEDLKQKRIAKLYAVLQPDKEELIMNTEKRKVGRPETLGHLSAEERIERLNEQWRNARIKRYQAQKQNNERVTNPSKLAALSAEERLARLKKQRREYYERSRDSARKV
ncbi:hypothetical protein HAP94_09975 [Acidithiobacillus ferrivorans]|nr:hypothetical protein [Acidithiobacillus ferrivorans]